RVQQALSRAEQATLGERDLRRETIRQVANAHRVMLESLRHLDVITSEDSRLLGLIREFYHQQVQSSTGLGTELAEILGEGLTTLSFLESRQYQLPDLALEDTGLVLRLSKEHPDSVSLLLSRAHSLNERRQVLRKLGREPEADAILGEITALAEQEPIINTPDALERLVPSLLAMLWNAEDWPRALKLLERTLQREQDRFSEAERPEQSWNTLLSLQSQRMGLLSRLERWPEADEAFEEWLRLSWQFQGDSPGVAPVLAVQRLRVTSQHLQSSGLHVSRDRQLALLRQGRNLFENLHRLRVSPAEQVATCVDWLQALESLPPEVVPSDELDSAWESVRRALRLAGPDGPPRAVLPALTSLRLRSASRSLAAQRPAEALELARENLAELDAQSPSVPPQHAALRWETLALAARACRELGQNAEELSYLSRAADIAPPAERAELDRRFKHTARQLGVPWPAAVTAEIPTGE
ncbi:MAG: hypothetical protein ACKO3P_12840, partial [Planctomycetaceae bacterium]